MASDFFIKIDGVDGESSDKNHSKWIEVLSFDLGSQQNIGAARGTDTSGRGQFLPFVFTHLIDAATPKLQECCMKATKVAKVQFAVCRAVAGAQVPVFEVTMENVKVGRAEIKAVIPGTNAEALINNFTTSDNTYLPVEQVELVAGKITWKVTSIKPDGTKGGAVETNFNQVENA